MNQVWERLDCSGAELVLALAIADFANDQGFLFPSVATLAKKTRQSERTVQRQLAEFRQVRWLEVEELAALKGGRGRSVRYRISEAWLKGDSLSWFSDRKGDRLAPFSDERVTPEGIKGDTTMTQKGDTAMSPDPSLTLREPRSDARARDSPGAHQGAAERGAQFQAFRAAYPLGTYGDNVWQYAERNFWQLVDESETAERLLESAKAYNAQQLAMSKIGSQYVKHPHKFLSEGKWRGPFPLPATPEAADKARRHAQLEAAWTRVRTHVEAIGCPLQPAPNEPVEGYEFRVKKWETSRAQSTSGPKHVASILHAKAES